MTRCERAEFNALKRDNELRQAECERVHTAMAQVTKERDRLFAGFGLQMFVDVRAEQLVRKRLTAAKVEGLKEAVTFCNEHHAKDHWYITKLKARLEARIKELEAT